MPQLQCTHATRSAHVAIKTKNFKFSSGHFALPVLAPAISSMYSLSPTTSYSSMYYAAISMEERGAGTRALVRSGEERSGEERRGEDRGEGEEEGREGWVGRRQGS